MANALPGHLRGLDQRPINLQDRPAPAHSGTTHLVHVSTAAVYEPLPDGNLNERFPVQLTDPYSATKAAIEDLLTEYSSNLGLVLQLHLMAKHDSLPLLIFAGGVDVCRGMVWVAS